MNRFYLRAMLSLLPFVMLNDPAAVSQEVCGQYATAPGSTVRYMHIPATADFETLPIRAKIDVSCDDDFLRAELLSPIIGIDEDGNEIFPTGLMYPITTTSAFDPTTNYTGSLQGTQYNYDWEFNSEAGDAVRWSGFVSWFGGRYEETQLDNVVLIPVAEPTVSSLLIAGLAMFLLWRGKPLR